MKRGYNLI